MMDGLILVQKPKGMTSHDIIARIRKILKIKKAGHFGTLDPSATGLLLVAVGKATRLFPYYLDRSKTYEGQIRLGYATDTYDTEGIPSAIETKSYPDEATLKERMAKFIGEIDQIPPPYSAKKYKGEALYKRVRAKKEYELKPARVYIHYFKLKKYAPPLLDFTAKCSSGTYMRSLAHDLGQDLGCGAHLERLARTEIGEFHIGESHTLAEIEEMHTSGQKGGFLRPIENLLSDLPRITVGSQHASLIQNGREFFPDNVLVDPPCDSVMTGEKSAKKDIVRIFDAQGKFLALAKKSRENDSLHPFLVFTDK